MDATLIFLGGILVGVLLIGAFAGVANWIYNKGESPS
jgi:hypothetical protein